MSQEKSEYPKDWCPSCGESQAEHSPEQAERCYEAFLATDKLIHAAIDRATAARKRE